MTLSGDIGMRRTLVRILERSWPLAACALLMYILLASSHIVDGDNAEFATLGGVGGRAHPSGYPLYVLWLRVWSWLPGATPAHTAALATAILGAATIGVLHAACRAWGAGTLAATVAAAIFGAAPVVLRYHCEAEAFAMNNVAAALILWIAAEKGPLRGGARGAVLGLIAGAALCDHLTCVLLAPIGIHGVVRAVRESRATTIAWVGGGLAVGLLPYVYLWLADGLASWGIVSSPSDLVAFVLRREFGGATSFLVEGTTVSWTASVAAGLAGIARSWLWLPALAGFAMIAMRIRRPVGESRWAWGMLLASFLLTGPVLASQFNIDPHGLGMYVSERFYILPALLLAPAAAAAFDIVCTRISRPAVAQVVALAGFVVLSVSHVPALARIHSPAMELGARNLLRSLPPRSIVVVTADDQCFGARYLQIARGERPDVALICSGLIAARWYRSAWSARDLDLPATTGPLLGASLLRSGRPVFVDPSMKRLLSGFSSFPFGIVMRILPVDAPRPTAAEVATINRDLYRGYDLDYPRPGLDDGYAALAHHRYAANWAVVAQLLDASGDRAAARDAFELTRALQPTGARE